MEEISVEKKKDKKKKIQIFGTPGSRSFWEFLDFKKEFKSFYGRIYKMIFYIFNSLQIGIYQNYIRLILKDLMNNSREVK